ncbi:Thioredoxin domain-containing protein 17 [Dinochytrium kinnereticum]|nr:Thioredoxin domain-containing protein 17 [Dinochytrium kinnereticum]
MQVKTLASSTTFDADLAEILKSHSGRVFAYLFANRDPETNQSWCPDCRDADPLVVKYIGSVQDAMLLEVPAGDRPTWKDPNNFYRLHPVLRAPAVPMLYEIGKDGQVIKRLVEAEAYNETLLTDFIK